MKITITGPRSIGKTTVSKLLADKLNLKYISSDEIAENALKKVGGLDKATKSGKIKDFIEKQAYELLKQAYEKDNFVFDLAGGAIASKKFAKVAEKVRKLAQTTILIGLLPSKDITESINLLFEREKEREHFKEVNKKELFEKVKDDYKKLPSLFKTICDKIIYTKNKSPEEIVKEIEDYLLEIKY